MLNNGSPSVPFSGKQANSLASLGLNNGNTLTFMVLENESGKERAFASFVIHGPDGQQVGKTVTIDSANGVIQELFGVSTKIRNAQAIELADGSFVLSWSKRVSQDSDSVQWFQRFDVDGNAIGGAKMLHGDLDEAPTTGNVQLFPLSNGGFGAAFMVDDFFEPENNGLNMRTFRANGTPRDNGYSVIDEATNAQTLVGGLLAQEAQRIEQRQARAQQLG